MSPFIEDFRRKYKFVNNSEDCFRNFVVDTEMMLGIKTDELSSLIRIPTSTIKRWKSGEGCPHIASRLNMLEFLKKALVV